MIQTRRRVYLCGRGATTAFGVGCDALEQGVFRGATAIAPLRRLAGGRALTHVAAEFPADVVERASNPSDLPYVAGLLAAKEALAECGLRRGEKFGLVLATTKADLSGIVGSGDGFGNPHRLAERIAKDLQLSGPIAAVSCACASGLSALALGARWIVTNRVDRVVVIGAEALTRFVMDGFSALFALSPESCRPFDRTRNGITLGEGAAAIVLSSNPQESLGFELAGWGESNDSVHVTAPNPEGTGIERAILRALDRAEREAVDVDYVHLHGTGTIASDASEVSALTRVFGRSAPMSGTKAQTGHTLGAAGVLETLVCLAALQRSQSPGNLQLNDCEYDDRVHLPRTRESLARADVALKVSAGFGGINVAVVLART